MHQFSSILAAVDGSPESQAALDVACAIARDAKGHLTIVHVGQPHLHLTGRHIHAVPEPVEERREDLATVRRAAERARQAYGLDVDTEMPEGEPVEEILAAAERVEADTIVVGSRGLGGLKRLLLGSVAEGLMERSTRPVLVVRGHNSSPP